MMQQKHLVLVLLQLTFSIVVWGAPTIPNQAQTIQYTPKIFGNKNAAQIINGHVAQTNDVDEEEQDELDLEKLKSHINEVQLQVTPTISTSTSTTLPRVTKKPENEEAPAISDNANSLKFPHHNPDESPLMSLFAKKNGRNIPTTKQQQQQQHNVGGGISFGNGYGRMRGPPSIGGITSSSDDDNDVDEQATLGGLMGDLLLGEHDRSTFPQRQGSSVDYTPQDIAEYVFWTGDERGVAAAIGDFLSQGVVSREDAVRFLEDVKHELSTIRNRYTTAMIQSQHTQQQQDFPSMQDGFKGYPSEMGLDWGLTPQILHPSSTKRENSFLPPSTELWMNEPTGGFTNHGQFQSPVGSNSNLLSVEELDYDEIAEKLRTVDAKMRELALEDVIYQIGKNLFAESLKNSAPGDSTAKFSKFVESQSASGKIPKDLEKDVLDALVEAFVDAVDEKGAQQLELENQLEEQKPISAKILHTHKEHPGAASSFTLTTTPPSTIHGNKKAAH